jgi:hypothetical protein
VTSSLNSGCGGVPRTEIIVCLRAKEEPGEYGEQQAVHDEFLYGMKKAQHDMEADPGESKPARPIVAEPQKDAGEDGDQGHQSGPQHVCFKRLGKVDLREVGNESGQAGDDINNRDNGDGERTCHS